MIAFGPVPSRRLGRSLGVNNIPPKTCSYSCVYCQIGNTTVKQIDRSEFYTLDEILRSVEKKIGRDVDYITFVPDGEPTLDINLGKEAKLLRKFGIALAIISNSSLIWREDVREDLSEFDYVSLKLDAVSERIWKRVNRPHRQLKLKEILDGMLEFRDNFGGKLVTETMLINIDYGDELQKLAAFLKELKPDIAYISTPTRPPCEKWVRKASEVMLNKAYQIFSASLGADRVRYLIEFEGGDFSISGGIEDEILSITAVHPIREDALNGIAKNVVDKLIKEGKVVKIEYQGKQFYLRKLK